jgi:ATP-dependent Clp protease ATP-binding subunit ClpC
MFERFTDRARRVVVLAQDEARELEHNYIGTEHLLLGLLREGEGVAARALDELGISRTAVREQVVQLIGRGGHTPSGHIPFTPRAKKALELSLREALQLNHNHIGTEHLLLGLIREGEGVAAQVLVELGAGLHQVRAKVLELVPAAPVEGMEFSGPARAAVSAPVMAGILRRLDEITVRLTAIERHLGLAGSAATGSGGAGAAATGAGGAGGAAGTPGEAGGPGEPAGEAGGETSTPPGGETGTGG